MAQKDMEIVEGYEWIHFNEKGNVNRANTVVFPQGNIIIELGSGRLKYEE
ncbi:MAG: hypothetical protein IJ875_03590 [Solobacterium sp.]|nr:hypothetical protein [Solobacterium sp.]